jgi:hypothetical protein
MTLGVHTRLVAHCVTHQSPLTLVAKGVPPETVSATHQQLLARNSCRIDSACRKGAASRI